MRHLMLRLESPMMAFGGDAIDARRIIRPYPAASMITGLLANALGFHRTEKERHQMLQDNLVFATRIDREPFGKTHITDFQTVQLNKSDKGWTTTGKPEERGGGSYSGPERLWCDYWPDMQVTVALRLNPMFNDVDIDGLAVALNEPTRPLFIGRKSCLPSVPLFEGFADAETSLGALLSWPLADRETDDVRMFWASGEDCADMDNVTVVRDMMVTDKRSWMSGLHGGKRWIREGVCSRACIAV